MAHRWISVLVLFLVPACGGGSSNPGDGNPPPAPGPDPVETLAIDPGDVTLDIGDVQVFTAIKTTPTGSTPVAADWVTDAPATALLSSSVGTSITVTAGDQAGPATLTATFGGLVAKVTLEVVDPNADSSIPTPVFGSRAGEIISYPLPGAGDPVSLYPVTGQNQGLLVTRDGSALYALVRAPEGAAVDIMNIDMATGVGTSVASLPPAILWFGLAIDTAGRLIVQGYSFADTETYVRRITPATGGVEDLGVIGPGIWMYNVCVGSDDRLKMLPVWPSGTYIHAHVPGSGTSQAWATMPDGLGDNPIPLGMTMNTDGEIFAGSNLLPYIYRFVDVNGNGSALDDGEIQLFATIPGIDLASDSMVGIAAAPGGKILLNVCQAGGLAVVTFPTGIYWIGDFDGDGAVAESEFRVYSTTQVYPATDGGCLVTP